MKIQSFFAVCGAVLLSANCFALSTFNSTTLNTNAINNALKRAEAAPLPANPSSIVYGGKDITNHGLNING